jgi:hypothetical protein
VTGDFDDDNDVDQHDFGMLQRCYSGIGEPWAPGCGYGDLDSDEDVDMNDFGIFVGCLRGPGEPADAGCAG